MQQFVILQIPHNQKTYVTLIIQYNVGLIIITKFEYDWQGFISLKQSSKWNLGVYILNWQNPSGTLGTALTKGRENQCQTLVTFIIFL